jgi:protein-histidine pros-kinase
MLALAGIFAATMAMLNVMLHTIVIKRVTNLAAIADQMSLGNLDAGEFRSNSRDEIGTLTEALGRMKTSMVQALKMLEE